MILLIIDTKYQVSAGSIQIQALVNISLHYSIPAAPNYDKHLMEALRCRFFA